MTSLLLVLSFSAAPATGVEAHYLVLPGGHREKPPFEVVIFTRGPSEGSSRWWELSVFPSRDSETEALFRLRCLTDRDPLARAQGEKNLRFFQYRLLVPGGDPPLSFVDVNTSGALLPPWRSFRRIFIPAPARGTDRTNGFPHTCVYLGQVLTLKTVTDGIPWRRWKGVRTLSLDPELLVGTGRTFKDTEGRRLPRTPERRDYTYVPFTVEDYRTMIQAGMNYFGIAKGTEKFVRIQPVFYRKSGREAEFPADLYRSNYLGPVMFMDEPTSIMIGDSTVNTTLRYFSDAAALIVKRVRSLFERASYALDGDLRARGIGLGDAHIVNLGIPTWETRYETAFYQLEGGAGGFVHEGRYNLERFNEFARASTGFERRYTAREMFLYHDAFLRGAARHFRRYWGMSIYGQADPALSPLAVRLAYDLGARFVWFWTSDHEHHLPWNEQLELARILKKHGETHPRPSIRPPRPVLDTAIVIPYGYFLVLESATGRRYPSDLWWVRELDPEGKNEASRRYRRLMRAAFRAFQRALDSGESFDFTVDDGREPEGYRRIVRLKVE